MRALPVLLLPALMLSACGSIPKPTPTTAQISAEVVRVCGEWREQPQVSFDRNLDTPETVDSARNANQAARENNAARTGFGCPKGD